MIVVKDMSVALIHLPTLPRANFHHVKKTKKKNDCMGGCAKLFFAGRESGTNCIGGSPEAKETNGSFFLV